jgi:AraC-like DNA-binding protein
MMKHSIELMLDSEVQRLFNHFTRLTGVRIAYFDPEGRPLRVGLQKPGTGFCACVRGRLGLNALCVTQDARKQRECALHRRTLTYRCHAGLYESITPVFAEGTLLGYVMIGQIRGNALMHSTLRQKCHSKADWSILKREFETLPLVSAKQRDSIVFLFRTLVDNIVLRNLVTLRKNLLLARALAFINERLESSVRISEVAHHCGRSVSAVSHLFTRELGRSFREEIIRRRLDRADELFRGDAELSIKEIAERLAFCDPFYFSRIYKKYRGYPPSKMKR